ncbi:hypothetical protein [Methanolapillus ohkumae]|uniref:Uncharacterized protein n=1 Tax=Methanolapillus ohkumae TaxID=3028298 RepID=A0AA96ZXJ8_9EURY|nr:hypothetical protein MsAm2_09330 [Methanosarcinaceae archaeon Am2]
MGKGNVKFAERQVGFYRVLCELDQEPFPFMDVIDEYRHELRFSNPDRIQKIFALPHFGQILFLEFKEYTYRGDNVRGKFYCLSEADFPPQIPSDLEDPFFESEKSKAVHFYYFPEEQIIGGELKPGADVEKIGFYLETVMKNIFPNPPSFEFEISRVCSSKSGEELFKTVWVENNSNKIYQEILKAYAELSDLF